MCFSRWILLWVLFCAIAAAADVESLPLPDRSPSPASLTLQTRSYDRLVILHWGFQDDSRPAKHVVFRADSPNGPWTLTATSVTRPHWIDRDVVNGRGYFYRVSSLGPGGVETLSNVGKATPVAFRQDRDFLDAIQQTALDYAWFEANPRNGLVRDRTRTNSPASIAANGFALSSLVIGVERGWLPRSAVAGRVLTTLRTFAKPDPTLKQDLGHRGWFYHFLDMNTSRRVWKCELSSIDTALLLAGVLDAREFFNQSDPIEAEIRLLANALFAAVDWNWMRNGEPTLTMGWHPEKGFIQTRWKGYNEAMILYLLGIGAGEGALPAESWQAWTQSYRWEKHEGTDLLVFSPLFGHQYSHCWVDFRHILDNWNQKIGVDYFETSRRATLSQKAYAIRNPGHFPGYGANQWGFTACDGPEGQGYHSYSARGASPPENDDGTIAPTAAGASIPFARNECVAVLRNLHDRFRERIWTPYGFCDAFNLKANWWDPEVLGIDQLPVLIQIENDRSGSTWRRMMSTPEIRRGLQRAGFVTKGNLAPVSLPPIR